MGHEQSGHFDRKVLFDGQDIVVIEVSSDQPKGVVTFQSWLAEPLGIKAADGATGFAEQKLPTMLLDGLHIIPRRNHWYQTPEMVPVLDIAHRFVETRKAITYGSSMGGYGALTFGGRLDIPSFALVPQFSLDPEVAPFETRWREEFAQIGHFDNTLVSGSPARFRGFTFYDPFVGMDAQQVGLFRPKVNVRFVACPFAGHPVPAFLQSTYRLSRVLAEIIEDRFNPAALAQSRREGRLNDVGYCGQLAVKARGTGRHALADFVEGPMLKNPELRLKVLWQLFVGAINRKDLNRARAYEERAEKVERTSPEDFMYYGLMHFFLRDFDSAIKVLEEGIALAPGHLNLNRHLIRVKEKRDHFGGSTTDV